MGYIESLVGVALRMQPPLLGRTLTTNTNGRCSQTESTLTDQSRILFCDNVYPLPRSIQDPSPGAYTALDHNNNQSSPNMARRSSARLRARDSSTPQRVSLSHDAPLRPPRTAPPKMSSLHESDEMPGAFPRSPSPLARQSLTKEASTPRNLTPIKPSDAEMHPQLHHLTTAKPLEEARHLGFSSMVPQTEPPKQSNSLATLQGTPTKSSGVGLKSPDFKFTFRREQSLDLSPDAKRLMSEMRQEAARIREQMVTNGKGVPQTADDIFNRKIAKPTSQKSRFSDVHNTQFQKMNSIAGHASAFRAQKTLTVTTPSMQQAEQQQAKSLKRSPSKARLDQRDNSLEPHKSSLKRSPSKAQLDQNDKPSSSLLQRSPSKPNMAAGSHLPRSTTLPNLQTKANNYSTSSSKRIKRSEADDVSATRQQSSSDDEKPLPSTPRTTNSLLKMPSQSNLARLSTPTRASMARVGSVKSVKSSMSRAGLSSPKPASTPLLARSPSKASLFPNSAAQSKSTVGHTVNLLSQSPFKSPLKKPSHAETDVAKTPEAPLLTRSPMKMSINKTQEAESRLDKTPRTPLLSRLPSKIPMPELQDEEDATKSPGRSHVKGLIGRLNMLRSSPMKSILRSPQRLYSDDPAKVAAGTHLATPPKFSVKERGVNHGQAPATAPANKRVDFSSSTKARFDEREASSTPTKRPTPPTKDIPVPKTEPRSGIVSYPALPTFSHQESPSPQKRRETVGPLDFTFRAGAQRIIFSQSPSAPVDADQPKRRATIRHVSSDFETAPAPLAVAGSKKRKFDFENIVSTAEAGGAENKENDDTIMECADSKDDSEHRPAKRSKANPTTVAPATKKTAEQPTTTFRRPTLGVKPKGVKTGKDEKDKRTTTISQSRLNALAQPKRRG